jgi:sterol desaturase/sphingolipid hydroxylase (fatty acid hydroxylase superfamily)
MNRYLDIIINGYQGYASHLWKQIVSPDWKSYFYWLIGVSLVFFVLEVVIPWRKNQKILRQDFFLDMFYMFFNFFIFWLIIYAAASDVIVDLFNNGILAVTGFDLQQSNPMRTLPLWGILIIGFLVRDFVQWWIHRLLHRVEWLWNFHKVHHSVQEMGFAAHLRYHWMETIVYRSLEYIPLALLGIGLHDFFIIHIFTLSWGHYNHANVSISPKITGGIVGLLISSVIAFGFFEFDLIAINTTIGQIITLLIGSLVGAFGLGLVMPKLFNSPEMHIWHHVEELPEGENYGVNFGLTLAIWDYIFGTNYVPRSGKDIKLGFPGVSEFPTTFGQQSAYGITKTK